MSGSGLRYDLVDKVVLVTGGGAGIGLATARQLVARGARVAVVDRDGAAAKTAAGEHGDHRALAIECDVTDRDGMVLAVGQVVDHFGRLDVVVANAGVTPPPATLRQLPPEEFDRVIAVNLTGVFNTIRPTVPQLIEHRGHVVVVASCAAFSPPLGGATYMVSKSAVEVLSRAFRIELAPHGVGVTTSYLGIVETDLARSTLDDDPLGADIERLLPGPLRKRISAEHAAATLVRAIERRSAEAVVPRAWLPLAMARGVLAPVTDRVLAASPTVHRLIRAVEHRHPEAADNHG